MTAIELNSAIIKQLDYISDNENLLTKVLNYLKTLTKEQREDALYDPQTGKYLNDETMQAIKDSIEGKNVVECGSFDNYLKIVNEI
ncbi:MAG: hypothetical protein J6P44_04420 [Bacteroidales bacterium]|nr:hypothetical protein [Bacteroidales bacterium]